jgi:hypothetical protein
MFEKVEDVIRPSLVLFDGGEGSLIQVDCDGNASRMVLWKMGSSMLLGEEC